LSSILKALKKLESDRVGQEKVQSLSRAVHLKKGKTPHAKTHRGIPGFAGFMVLLIVLFSMGVFFWKLGVNNNKKVSGASLKEDVTPRTNTLINTPLKQTAKKPVMENTVPQNPDVIPSKNMHPKIPDKNRMETIQPGSDPSTGANPDPINTISEKSLSLAGHTGKEASKDALPHKEPDEFKEPSVSSSKSVETKTEGSKTDPVVPSKRVQDRFEEEDIEPLEDATIKLMAIAWSDDPKSRIAVINDRVVREGDVIGGMTISRINEDEIIFRNGGEFRKLLFRLQ
jgi:hypothetical protein